jgi:hypothetical protein
MAIMLSRPNAATTRTDPDHGRIQRHRDMPRYAPAGRPRPLHRTARAIVTLACAAGLAACTDAGAAQDTGTLEAVQLEDRIRVTLDGEIVTEYKYAPTQKYPYFYPLNGPASGESVTTETSEPYPHHQSLFFGLDFVTTPSNFEAVGALPGDRELGLGIVDARNTRLETVDNIRQSVERVSRVAPLERIHLSPNMGLEFLPRKNARAKIQRIVEAARTTG